MDFLPETLAHGFEKCAAATEDNVCEKVFTNVIVALHDRIETIFVDTFKVMTRQVRLEQDFGASEALIADQNLPSVGKFVILLAGMGLFCVLHCLAEVADDDCHSLLDVAHDFKLSRSGEGETTLLENLSQVLGEVATG